MLAYREWKIRIENELTLYSAIWPVPWTGQHMTADEVPTVDNNHGIYAYAQWSQNAPMILGLPGMELFVLGAVDVFGTVQVHEDDIVRAEHARILALRIVPPAHGFHIARQPDGKVTYCMCNGKCESIQLQELEEELLQRYNVPRLPDGTGPWPAPFGARQA